jgi:hypothetical protein
LWKCGPRRDVVQFFAFTEPKKFLKNRNNIYRIPIFVSPIFFTQATPSIATQYYSSFVTFLQTVFDVIPRPLHQQPITNSITNSPSIRNHLSRTFAAISRAFSRPFDLILLSESVSIFSPFHGALGYA